MGVPQNPNSNVWLTAGRYINQPNNYKVPFQLRILTCTLHTRTVAPKMAPGQLQSGGRQLWGSIKRKRSYIILIQCIEPNLQQHNRREGWIICGDNAQMGLHTRPQDIRTLHYRICWKSMNQNPTSEADKATVWTTKPHSNHIHVWKNNYFRWMIHNNLIKRKSNRFKTLW